MRAREGKRGTKSAGAMRARVQTEGGRRRVFRRFPDPFQKMNAPRRLPIDAGRGGGI